MYPNDACLSVYTVPFISRTVVVVVVALVSRWFVVGFRADVPYCNLLFGAHIHHMIHTYARAASHSYDILPRAYTRLLSSANREAVY